VGLVGGGGGGIISQVRRFIRCQSLLECAGILWEAG